MRFGGFFRSMFRAPPAPPKDRRVWNEDWRVGDIAECVTTDWHEDTVPWHKPQKGQRLTVSGFCEDLNFSGHRAYFLEFADWPVALQTTAFRKVRPVSTSAETSIGERILKAKPGPDKVRENRHA